MSVIEKLKAESLALRKTKNPVAASIVFALSEIEKFGKNNGNRATTEDEAIKVIQKLIATIDENLKVTTDDGRKVAFNFEKNILMGVLPQMASDDEILDLINSIMAGKTAENMPKKSEFMQAARFTFGAKVDMKRVSQILLDTYGV